MRADWALRAAVDMPLRPRRGLESARAAAGVIAPGFFGGRPRRFVGPCKISIARLSRARSAMSKTRIWSVVAVFDESTGAHLRDKIQGLGLTKFGASGCEFCVMIWARILAIETEPNIFESV